MSETVQDIKRIAIFGGTFDPVHIGHKRILRAAGKILHLDHAFVMPAMEPPHKKGEKIVSGADRLEMCRTAFSGMPKVIVSDWEILREGTSYSYDTVKAFSNLYPQAKIFFIMGSDQFMEVDTWHEAEELLKLCIPVCFPRSDDDLNALRKKQKKLGNALVIGLKPMVISSTAIRSMIAKGEYGMAGEYLDSRVLEYIRSHGLYTQG